MSNRRVMYPPNPLGWFERWRKQVRNSFRQAAARGEYSSLLMVWALIMLPVLAAMTADQLDGIWTLLIVGTSATLLGYLLARSSLSEATALLVSGSYGLGVMVAISLLFLSDGSSLNARADDLYTRLEIAFDETQQPSEEILEWVFVLFSGVLWWFLAHNTAWHVFRIDRVWRVVVPPGALMLAYIAQYEGEAPLGIYIVLYVLLALLLVVRSHVDAREYEWYRHQVRYTRHLRQAFLRVGAILALLFVLIGWLLPSGSDREQEDRLLELFENIDEALAFLDQLASPVDSSSNASEDFYGGDELELGGAISLGEDLVMYVTAPASTERYYWRSTVYDTYLAGSWSHRRTVRATKEDAGLRLNIGGFQSRQTIEQQVENQLSSTNLVYAAPQAIFFDVPVRAELDCVQDLGSTACVNAGGQVDLSIARSLQAIEAGDRYTMESSVSTASATELRTASRDYPDWVRNRYLQGVEQVTPRLLNLTQQIIANAGASTPYDQAKAIEAWLRANILYNEKIPAPPENQDPVDWVVFDYREGYCNYYASAMILMLRSQGIPARMGAGFSQGDYDPEKGAYVVRQRHAHTWVEVYFPDYGWVTFEPTANEQALDREGDTPPNPQQSMPTFTPQPSPTPQPSATPSPLAQSFPTISPTPQQNEQPIVFTATPTLTPTPSPTATALNTPPPQETEIETEGGAQILQLLLWACLGSSLLMFALVGAALALLWWVEYRGLGGVGPVARIYALLGVYGKWLGVSLNSEQTPDERRQHLAAEMPEAAPAIGYITELYVQDRFAPTRPENAEQEVKQTWAQLRLDFIRQKFRQWLRLN